MAMSNGEYAKCILILDYIVKIVEMCCLLPVILNYYLGIFLLSIVTKWQVNILLAKFKDFDLNPGGCLPNRPLHNERF